MVSTLDTHIQTLQTTKDLPYCFEIELPDVKKPIKTYLWRHPSSNTELIDAHLCIYTHGAGGTCMSSASANLCRGIADTDVIQDVSPLVVLGFDGPMHLASRTKTFVALIRWAAECDKIKTISLAGRSMGCRAATMAAKECLHVEKLSRRLVLQSYPLIGGGKGTKDEERKQILLDLPSTCKILFQIGSEDEMCPMQQMQELWASLKAHSSIITVQKADHGMQLIAGTAARGSKAATEECLGGTLGSIVGEWLLSEEPAEACDWTVDVKIEDEQTKVAWTGFAKSVARAEPTMESPRSAAPVCNSKSKRKAPSLSHPSSCAPEAKPTKRVTRSNGKK